MKNVISLLIVSVLLSGCATTSTVTVNAQKEVRIPSQYLDCKPIPKSQIPDPEKLTDQQVSNFILKINTLLSKCASDDQSVIYLVDQYNKLVKQHNSNLK